FSLSRDIENLIPFILFDIAAVRLIRLADHHSNLAIFNFNSLYRNSGCYCGTQRARHVSLPKLRGTARHLSLPVLRSFRQPPPSHCLVDFWQPAYFKQRYNLPPFLYTFGAEQRQVRRRSQERLIIKAFSSCSLHARPMPVSLPTRRGHPDDHGQLTLGAQPQERPLADPEIRRCSICAQQAKGVREVILQLLSHRGHD